MVKLITESYVGVRGGFWEEMSRLVWSTLLILGDHLSLFLAELLASCSRCVFVYVSIAVSVSSGVCLSVCCVSVPVNVMGHNLRSGPLSLSLNRSSWDKLQVCANLPPIKPLYGLPAILF